MIFSNKTIAAILVLGFVLNFVATIAPLYLGFGGHFNSSDGKNSGPAGFPLFWLNPDPSDKPPVDPDHADEIPLGWQPRLKEDRGIFVIDFIFWVAIVSGAVYLTKTKKEPIKKTAAAR